MSITPAVFVSGNTLDMSGAGNAAQIVFTLVNTVGLIPYISGTMQAATLVYSVTANSSGAWAANIYGIDQLTDGTNMLYQVECFPLENNRIAASPTWSALYSLTSGTYDLSTKAQSVLQGTPVLTLTGPAGPAGPAGPTGPSGSSGSVFGGPSPWFDVTAPAYGARAIGTYQTTTSSTSGTAVTLASAIDFQVGDGIVIQQAGTAGPSVAGVPTAIPTPTITSCVANTVTGSNSISYKIVGADEYGALSAASAAVTVANAPAVFGNLPVVISSISQSSGVVTVNTSTPISAVVGQQVLISNVTISGAAALVGYYAVASAPTTSQFTYALAGNAGSGTVGATSYARLTNTYNITAITRIGTTITVTTNAAHNFHYQSASSPYSRTVAVIQGIDQVNNTSGTADLDGQYVVLSASGTSVTLDSALDYLTTETGILTGTLSFQPTITVFEYITVTCPLSFPEPVFFYIYANYGSGYVLIGKTLPYQQYFLDYGPFLNQDVGYPAYVPTGAPPASAQNRLYAGVISVLSGTTATVTPSVPTNVAGAVTLHDNSVAIQTAMTAANAADGGTVYFPPTNNQSFIINYPIFMPTSSSLSFLVGSYLIVNETIWNKTASYMGWSAAPGVSGAGFGQFEQTATVGVLGAASPMLFSYNGPLSINSLSFYGTHGSGQTYVNTLGSGGENFSAANCNFSVGNNQCGTSVPVVLASGNGYQACPRFTNCVFIGYFYGMGNGVYTGTGGINLGPALGLLALTGDGYADYAPNGLVLDGHNTFAGRGILFDGSLTRGTNQADISIYEFEAPNTPTLMLIGVNTGAAKIVVSHVVNDSQPGAIVGNWGKFSNAPNMTIDNCGTSGHNSILTGSVVPGITFINCANVTPRMLGQNVNYTAFTAGQGVAGFSTYVQEQGTPIIMAGAINNPIAWPIPIITGVTASASGSGTIAAATYYISITAVGWNSQEGAASSSPITSVTVNGSQGAAISWTALAGVKGYNVYSSVGGNSPVKQNPSIITSASFTWTTLVNDGAFPTVDSTGLPMLDQNGLTVPLVRLYGSTSGNAVIQTAAAAGTPNPLQLPTATGAVGSTLTTNGGSPQQLAWEAGTIFADQFSGADASIQINAAIAVAITNGGGTVDARGLGGVQYISEQINVGNSSNIPITLILPSDANWGVTITNGTSVGIMVYSSSALIADCPGTAHGAVVSMESTGNVVAVVSTYNGGAATQFVRISGISFNNINNGTVGSAVVVFQSVADNSLLENSQICNPYGIGLLIGGSAAGVGGGPSIIRNVWNLGSNGGTSNTTAQPVVIQGNSGTGGTVSTVRFYGGSIVEPGSGLPNLSILGGGGFYVAHVELFGVYMESTINSADSGTASIIVNHAGPISIFGCTSQYSFANGSFFVQLINSSNGLTIAGCQLGHANFVDNDVTGIDFVSNGTSDNLAFYSDQSNSQINAPAIAGATPTTGTGQIGLGTTVGFGNGTPATPITTTTKSTGTGPAAPQTIVNYLEIDIAGTKSWIPLVQ